MLVRKYNFLLQLFVKNKWIFLTILLQQKLACMVMSF